MSEQLMSRDLTYRAMQFWSALSFTSLLVLIAVTCQCIKQTKNLQPISLLTFVCFFEGTSRLVWFTCCLERPKCKLQWNSSASSLHSHPNQKALIYFIQTKGWLKLPKVKALCRRASETALRAAILHAESGLACQ